MEMPMEKKKKHVILELAEIFFGVEICREVFGNDIFDGLGRDGNAT